MADTMLSSGTNTRAAKANAERISRAMDPEHYYNKARNRFKEYYGSNQKKFNGVIEATTLLIERLLDCDEIPAPKVSARIKDRQGCLDKFDRYYRDDLERNGDEYEISDYVDDIVGIRVTCLYADNVNFVVQALESAFDVKKKKDKISEIEQDHSRFGYKGVHLDVCFDDARCSLPEYSQFSEFQFEIQVRTTVQDAWSEVDHKLKYKNEIPEDLKRRVVRLAALFELADQEFQLIRDETLSLEKGAEAAVASEGDTVAKGLDAFTLLRAMHEVFPEMDTSSYQVEALTSHLKKAKPNISTGELRALLKDHLPEVNKYVRYLSALGHGMGPANKVRHCVYASDAEKFGSVLFLGRRTNFDRWRETGSVFPKADDE